MDIQYDQTNDRWFLIFMYDINQLAAQQRRGYIYYSDDDGANWARVDTSQDIDRDVAKIVALQAGGVYGGGFAYGSTYHFFKYTSVGGAQTPAKYDTTTGASSGFGFLSLEVAGGYVLTNGPEGLLAGNPGADGYSVIGALPSLYNLGAASNPNGAALLVEDVTSNVVTYNRITAASTEPYEEGTVTLTEAPNGYSFAYGGGKYLLVAGMSSAYDTLEVWASSDGTDGSWEGPFYWDLTVDKEPSGDSTSGRPHYDNWFQVRYAGDGDWIVHFYEDLSGPWHLAKVTFGEAVPALPNRNGPLRSAISSQQPDIFILMDDEIGSSSVIDRGKKGYTNSVIGSPTFEAEGLVSDAGTAVLFGSTTDEGVQIEAVPTPLSHAHVFVLAHDDTAAVRVLAGSQADGYVIVLGSDHKLGVGLYDGGWTYTYGDDAIAADTATLCAVRIKGGVATIYVGNAYDTAAELDMPESATGYLTLGGLTDGEDSLTSCADGVTIDYYALIPAVTFDYADLVEANGGSYTGPTGSPQSDGAQFLLHGDESAASGPFPSRTVPGRNYYTFVNSVPGSPNKVSTEDASQSLVAGGKFSGGFYVPPFRPLEDDWSPWTAPYWSRKESHSSPGSVSELVLGQGEFTFACWMKPAQASPVQLFSNCHVEKIGSQWWLYGGITVIYTQEPGDASMGRVVVGIHSAKGQASDLQCTMMFRNIPGYTTAAFTHFALSREVLPDGTTRWHVFLNGKRAGEPSVSNYTADAYPDAYIHEGGQVNLGRAVGTSADHLQITKFGGGLYFDDALLITGEALYTEDFTPPTGAYSLE